MLHIPRTLLDRICTKQGEHLLRPEEIDHLRSTIHRAIDDAALITARHTVFLSGEEGMTHQGVELKIVIKLQADK